jgi:hypothetical protein
LRWRRIRSNLRDKERLMATHASARSKMVYRTSEPLAPRAERDVEVAAHSENGAQSALVRKNLRSDALETQRRPPSVLSASTAKQFSKRQRRQESYRGEFLFVVFISTALSLAWSERLEGHLSPKTGYGYLLGIGGALMMLSLLAYPLRKYWRPLQRLGTVRGWFTAHMILGLLGPAAIVVHSNFHLDSTNGAVAMAIMGLVVASGIVGRYVYAQIFEEASGKRLEVNELLHEAQALRAAFGEGMEHAPVIEAELASYETAAADFRNSRTVNLGAMMFLGRRTRASRILVGREAELVLSARALRERWTVVELRQQILDVNTHFDAYFAAVQRATRLNVFARIFAFWHVLHMPLFLLLILAAIGHVLAVHLY